jgi:hypothetical protein
MIWKEKTQPDISLVQHIWIAQTVTYLFSQNRPSLKEKEARNRDVWTYNSRTNQDNSVPTTDYWWTWRAENFVGTTLSASSILYLLKWPKYHNFPHCAVQRNNSFAPITRESIEIFPFWKKILEGLRNR